MLYDMVCDRCRTRMEVHCPIAERNIQRCPECDGLLVKPIGPVPTIGATWSKPIDFGKQGMVFETNAAARSYFKEHPTERITPKSDSAFQQRRFETRTHMETQAKRAGYRDVDHMRATWKKGHTEPQ